MWGHAYVESNDVIVVYVCCARPHVEFIDIIVSCMIRGINIIFSCV